MHIVLVHPDRLPVRKYGGAGRIVVWLCQGLTELGHEVTLLAGKGSKVPGVKVVEINPASLSAPGFEVARHAPGAELIHYHIEVPHPPSMPWLWTLHGNLRPGQVAGPRAVCLSADHARRHGTEAYVLNGVRLDEYEFRSVKGDYDLFLGQLHPDKGWGLAVEAAKRARFQLVVAGGWRPSLTRWVQFAGEVGGERKRDLLAGARCLWSPVQWDEPFGLHLAEALASGTPIIGCPRGALPEIVTPDVGGLGTTLEEWLALRERLPEWSPEACRRRAERHFSHVRMTQDYLRIYEHLLAQGSLPAGRGVEVSPV
jgi:glycosyltransferase involved in cell wall biosynthesis